NRIYTEASMHMLFAFMIKMKGFGLKAQYRLDYNYDTVALETQPWTLNFALGLYKLWYKKPEKDKKARSA
ncbi:MAG: hypothetical protein MRY83_07350, partial [Flavobacteriales bacterium]|nr:hypothetical protein [Flavobacteriales bacterium]